MLWTVKPIINCEITIVSLKKWSLLMLWANSSFQQNSKALSLMHGIWGKKEKYKTEILLWAFFWFTNTSYCEVIYFTCQHCLISINCCSIQRLQRGFFTISCICPHNSKDFFKEDNQHREMLERSMQYRGECEVTLMTSWTNSQSKREKKMIKILEVVF
jgi:hypothetical protein